RFRLLEVGAQTQDPEARRIDPSYALQENGYVLVEEMDARLIPRHIGSLGKRHNVGVLLFHRLTPQVTEAGVRLIVRIKMYGHGYEPQGYDRFSGIGLDQFALIVGSKLPQAASPRS